MLLFLITPIYCLNTEPSVVKTPRLPVMGFMTWLQYGCNINEEVISNAISEMDSALDGQTSLKDLGYVFVSIDDCWNSGSQSRGSKGDLHVDADRFPNGIDYLVNMAHSRSLKFGIYGDIGTNTCEKRPGSLGHFAHDAEYFANLKVDIIKVDGCWHKRDQSFIDDYIAFGTELKKKGILFSCSWPAYEKDHGLDNNAAALIRLSKVCDMWRNFNDIAATEKSLLDIIDYFAVTKDSPLLTAQRTGSFNDADMLLAGHNNIPISLQRMQFSIWAIIASPLYLSTDLGKLKRNPKAWDIVSNKRVIAVNQDRLAIQGWVAFSSPVYRVWVRQLSIPDTWAVCIQNLTKRAKDFEFKPEYVGWEDDAKYSFTSLWDTQGGEVSGDLKGLNVPGRDIFMFTATKL